ncbi:MAG: tetratricopeptide repeat protein [Candidatus Omnitrophota bacterium]|nr:MAG: tetratricopeptide repeat protein [Candidatus Omnitrophota bacterium]
MRVVRVFIIFLVLFVSFTNTAFSLNEEEEKFYVASKAFSDRFYKAAASLFKRFIRDFPESTKVYEAKLFIAKCYYFKDDYSKALEYLNEITEKKVAAKVWGQAYYWLAEVHFKGKNFRDSLKYSLKVIENYPGSNYLWWAYMLAANNYLELGRERSAEGTFVKIIDECKEDKLTESAYDHLLNFYFQQKKHSQLMALGAQYLRKYPKGSLQAKAYFYLGEALYAYKEFDEAVANYQCSLKFKKDTELVDLVYQGLGFSYLGKEDFPKAKNNIDKIEGSQLRLFSQGIYYFKIKEYKRALEIFDDFINAFPKNKYLVNVYLNKADTLYEMGRIHDSLLVYQYILNNFKGPSYADVSDRAHYGLAWGYLKTGEFKYAIEEFKKTLKDTNNPVVKISSQVQIADAYQEAADYDKALELYNDILRNNPNTVYVDYIQFQIGIIFLKTERLEEALLALRNLKDNFPSSRLIPQAQYYLAVAYFSKGVYRETQQLLEDFIKKFGRNSLIPKVYYLYGKCFFNNKRYSKAIEIFKKVLGKFNDKEIEELLYIDMGNAYLNLSLFDKAKKVWERFLSRFPHSEYGPSVSLYLGGLYEKEGNLQLAEKYYKKTITAFKESSSSHEGMISLGHLYWQEGDLAKAKKYFQELSEANTPLSFKAKMYLAKVYTQEAEYRKALDIYEELIASDFASSGSIILDKAFLLKNMKDYESAVSFFDKAVEEGMDSSKLRFSKALCLEKINRSKEAIDEYFKVIYMFDDQDYKVKAYFRIGRLYEKESNFGAAKEIYRKIADSGVEEAKIAQVRLQDLE